ncbi:hypothetical protein ALC62_07184 [Cyphomyrmex costatus]|uniref:Uncharacterized protein n=1 Tax=Cyphomyrmex costatus TaxID=456900 RepID=A0A151IIA5_9HYME|nr:hypothetical protein ALC62_07184 [Cyphomyrmex costatus]
MENLNKLRAKRTNVKGQLTQFVKFVRDHGEERREQLPDRIRDHAEELFGTYNEIQSQIAEVKLEAAIEKIPPPSQEELQALDAEIARERQSVEDVYFEYLVKAKRLVEAEQTNVAVHQQEQQVNNLTVKLPTLQLPKFNGSYDQWLMYKDTFTSVIDSNVRLTRIQKFQYLCSSLTGEALQVIHTLETTDENYEIAWRLIKERYENKKLIISTHIKELFELQTVNKGSHTALRTYIDSIRTHVRALEALKQPIAHWDTILIYLLSDKLDYTTRKDWELEIGKRDTDSMPSLEALLEFLTTRAHTLELVEGSKNKQEHAKYNALKKAGKKVNVAAIPQAACVICEGQHHVSKCEKLQKMSVPERREEVKKRQLCFNCLRKGHYIQACTASTCKVCSRKHNTILHMETGEQIENKNTTVMSARDESSTVESIVFIATAKIYVMDNEGNLRVCRAMLDPGSQSNIITKDLARKLQLKGNKVNVPISGISQTQITVKESTSIRIKSMHNEFSTELDCLIMPTITERMPHVKVNTHNWDIPEDLNLADPSFNLPETIDILIGSSHFWLLMNTGQRKLSDSLPRLQETQLGWIIGGELINPKVLNNKRVCNIATMNLDEQLQRFWSIEEVPTRPREDSYTPQERLAEDLFLHTVRRDQEGRYIVRMPRDESIILGDSENMAIKRFLATERKLNQQPELKADYHRFMKEYEEMNHMSIVKQLSHIPKKEYFYLPPTSDQDNKLNDEITSSFRWIIEDINRFIFKSEIVKRSQSSDRLMGNYD